MTKHANRPLVPSATAPSTRTLFLSLSCSDLEKKTTSLRAELTAKRPAAQLNVLADRKALSNNNHRWITPAVLMTNIRSTA
jgi:hypothetical protein